MKKRIYAVFCLTVLLVLFAGLPVIAASTTTSIQQEPYGYWPEESNLHTGSSGEHSSTNVSALGAAVLGAAASLVSVLPITAASIAAGGASGTAAGAVPSGGIQATGMGGTKGTGQMPEFGKTKKYKLYLKKSFGNSLQFGVPVQISARLSEVTADGLEYDRIDLTKKLEVFAVNSFIKVLSKEMVDNYLNVMVEAVGSENDEKAEEGIVCFKLSGFKEVFQNNIRFKLNGAAI